MDSSQYLFFGEAWTFKLYRETGDSCRQVNQGSVDWGANPLGTTYVLTDSATTYYYEVFLNKVLKRTVAEDLLGCAKCELRAGLPCKIR